MIVFDHVCACVLRVLQALLHIEGTSTPSELLQLITMDGTLAAILTQAGKHLPQLPTTSAVADKEVLDILFARTVLFTTVILLN